MVVFLLVTFLALPQAGQGGPGPSPEAPRLSQLAKGVRLRLPPKKRKLDNATVQRLSQELQSQKKENLEPGDLPGPPKAGEWQKRFQEARGRALGLEILVSRLQEKLRGCREQCKEGPILQRSLKRAELELQLMAGAPRNVIQEALAAGANPAWFRNLPAPEPIFPSWVNKIAP